MDLSANHILVVFLLTTLAGLATGIGVLGRGAAPADGI